jgi:hypothetical protein
VPASEENKFTMFLGCGIALLDVLCQTFGGSIIVSSSRVKMSVKVEEVIDVMRRTERTVTIDISVS